MLEVPVAESAVSFIDGQRARLEYRGIAVENLARDSSFEETSWLLLKGDLPTQRELAEKAIELNPERQQLADIYRKSAEIILSLEKTNRTAATQQAITRAMELLKRAQDAQAGAKQEDPAKVIASKLIISVPKNALDEVASGRLSFEAFRGYAGIERVHVTTPQKKDDIMK